MTASHRVRIIGDPVLRKKAEAVERSRIPLDVPPIIEMMSGLLAMEDGLALAAPQAGVSLRLFIAAPDHLEELKGHRIFINPELEPYGPSEKMEEGCLSIPGIYETLERPSRARIRAFDENGMPFSLDLSGLAARMVQHETDHLDGILFTDRLSPMKKRFLRRRLKELMEQAISS